MTAAAPHSPVNFGAISVNFIMWSLCFTKLNELSLGFLSGDHALTYSFNEVVSLGIIIMCSWWKVGCPQGADQFGIDLCRGHGFLYFETIGKGRGSGHSSSSIWPGNIYISSGSFEFMQGTSFHIIMHGQLLTDVPLKGASLASVYRLDTVWCRMLPMPVSVPSYECCPVV